MPFPDADRAVVGQDKVCDYLLNRSLRLAVQRRNGLNCWATTEATGRICETIYWRLPGLVRILSPSHRPLA